MTAPAPIKIEEHVALVHWFLRKRKCERWLRGGALEYADLVQAGLLGLHRAAETFDESKGTWTTHAVWHIRAAVGREIANRDAVIRTPCYIQAERAKQGLAQRQRVASLDTPARASRASDDGPGAAFIDLIAGDAPAPDAQLEADDRARLVERLMSEAQLSRRERVVLRERFGDREMTLDAIRPLIGGVVRERVRQIERDALEKMRAVVRRHQLEFDAA